MALSLGLNVRTISVFLGMLITIYVIWIFTVARESPAPAVEPAVIIPPPAPVRPVTPPAPPPAPAFLLSFPPEAKKLIINVGSNDDPPISSDPSIYTIGVEPVLKTAARIKPNPKLFVITAAIGPRQGLAKFFTYANGGVASSLSEAENFNWAYTPDGYPPVLFVPVITLKTLLEAIPPEIVIVYLKIDAEGWDLDVVESAGDSISRAQTVQTEILCYKAFQGQRTNWPDVEKILTGLGFASDPQGNRCAGGNKQFDGFWTQKDNCIGAYCARQPLGDGTLQLH
jgi:FkbM family methyltransferase